MLGRSPVPVPVPQASLLFLPPCLGPCCVLSQNSSSPSPTRPPRQLSPVSRPSRCPTSRRTPSAKPAQFISGGLGFCPAS